jgi:hypothetical protein
MSAAARSRRQLLLLVVDIAVPIGLYYVLRGLGMSELASESSNTVPANAPASRHRRPAAECGTAASEAVA